MMCSRIHAAFPEARGLSRRAARVGCLLLDQPFDGWVSGRNRRFQPVSNGLAPRGF